MSAIVFEFEKTPCGLRLEATLALDYLDTVALVEIDRDADEWSRATLKADFQWADWRPKYFLRVHHRVRQLLVAAHLDGITRIQLTVDAGDDKGHRWARALGFSPEGLLRCYAKGRDHVLYAHIDRSAAQQASSRAA